MTLQVELVHFTGCPNAARARENLRQALEVAGLGTGWEEWDLTGAATPPRVQGYGSPTVLVNGRDVTGGTPEGSAMSCRADGAPAVSVILGALRGQAREG